VTVRWMRFYGGDLAINTSSRAAAASHLLIASVGNRVPVCRLPAATRTRIAGMELKHGIIQLHA
jgi:hypothetical protein